MWSKFHPHISSIAFPIMGSLGVHYSGSFSTFIALGLGMTLQWLWHSSLSGVTALDMFILLFPEPWCSRFTQDRMGRSQSKVDEVLLHVLKRMHSPKVMEGLCNWVGMPGRRAQGAICPHNMTEEGALPWSINVIIRLGVAWSRSSQDQIKLLKWSC